MIDSPVPTGVIAKSSFYIELFDEGCLTFSVVTITVKMHLAPSVRVPTSYGIIFSHTVGAVE